MILDRWFMKELNNINIFKNTIETDLKKEYIKAMKNSYFEEYVKKIHLRNEVNLNSNINKYTIEYLANEYIDFDILNNVKCDKILVEFLRANHWIKKWFDIDYSKHTLKQNGYEHLELEAKKEMLKHFLYHQSL